MLNDTDHFPVKKGQSIEIKNYSKKAKYSIEYMLKEIKNCIAEVFPPYAIIWDREREREKETTKMLSIHEG